MRKRVLVLEDSPHALKRIRAALIARKVEFVELSQIESILADGLVGRALDSDEPVTVRWAEVSVFFSDYNLPGALMGDAAVSSASESGVTAIIGMSSDAEFNRRLLHAGATRAHAKQVVIGGLETGAFDSLISPGSP